MPLMVTVPFVGLSRRPAMCSKVLLPQPLGPCRVICSFSLMVREAPSRMVSLFLPWV